MSALSLPSTQGLGLRGHNINGCSINIDHPKSHHCHQLGSLHDALPLPTTLSIFFDPDRNCAFFRLRAQVNLQVSAETRAVPFFLHIPPDKIENLSLCQQTTTTDGHLNTSRPSIKACLRFRLAAPGSISVIAPLDLPPGHLRAANSAACNTLDALRLLSQQSAVYLSLPPATSATSDLAQLTALCQAVSINGRLHPDPVQANLRSLYRGKGGRVVGVDELTLPTNKTHPPPSLFANLPPAYPDIDAAAASPQPSTGSGSKRPRHKRRRTRSPSPTVSSRSSSRSSSSTPRYNTWKHLDLAVGEREKIMVELLRRTENKEKAIEELLRRSDKKEERLSAMLVEMDKKRALVAEETRKLAALVTCSRDCRGYQEQEQQHQHEEARSTGSNASQISTASPTPPGTPISEAQRSATSVSSNISDRLQAYIATQLDGLRDEVRTLQRTMGNEMEGVVDRMLEGYVEEEDMFDAVREAVDQAVAGIRDRVLDAWL